MMPWRQSQSTISGVLWPARLSHTRRIRSGGRSAGRLKRTANPSCHACHRARFAAGSSGAALAGSAATICPKTSFSQPCRTVLVPLVAGRRLTRPVAGWNRAGSWPSRRAGTRASGWRRGPPAASWHPDAARSGRGRPRPRTRPPAPSEPPARRRARSAFFLGRQSWLCLDPSASGTRREHGTSGGAAAGRAGAGAAAAPALLPGLRAADADPLREPAHGGDPGGAGAPAPEGPAVRGCRLRAPPPPHRPEAEGAIALPRHEFGLDVIALVGALRYREHRSVPEIHHALRERGVAVCERTVTNLLDRYDELVATVVDEPRRAALAIQQRVVLAIDGLQPDVGHEVLWVVRDCLSGQVLLARSLLSATAADLAGLLREVTAAIGVPVAGVVSDGQHSVRLAVGQALPGMPHQLCRFHYLREAGLPIFEAERHAQKELKKRVRGVRRIERAVEGRDDPEAEAVRGYCAAVRSALTDDGRPPLAASGLRLQARLAAIAASLRWVEERGG